MSIEELIGLIGTEYEYSILKILLLELRHLLINHLRSLVLADKVVQLESALSLDFSIDLDEDLEVPRHHVRERVAVRLHLLKHVVYLRDLLLAHGLAVLRNLHSVQLLQQLLELADALFTMLLDIGSLLEQRQEVAPYQVGADGHKAENVSSAFTAVQA